jgi:inner membrane transporter RhtA
MLKEIRPLRPIDRVPPLSFFAISAIFHYLGPSFAVLLFGRVPVLGVALLRIWSAALAFTLWRRPWRSRILHRAEGLALVIGLGAVLASMNAVFYLAIARLPLATVGAIEFLGVIVLAAWGARSARNVVALLLAIGGVAAISKAQIGGDAIGLVFAFANCALFVLYIILAHRLAREGLRIDGLAIAMLVAAAAIAPFAFADALPAFSQPALLLAGAGVGICSSVIPYVTDQLAMTRLPRASFALMLASLPVVALIIGAIVLRQFLSAQEVVGVALVTAAIAVHCPESA